MNNIYQKIEKKRLKSILLILAGIFFVIGIYYSINQNPSLLRNLSLEPAILIIVLGVPATLLLNTLEFILITIVVKKKISFLKSLEISIIGSAANMLPLPGGAITRVLWLNSIGTNYKLASLVTFAFALIWLGISFIVAGFCILTLADRTIGLSFILIGMCIFFISVRIINANGSNLKNLFWIILHRLFAILVDALRIWLCFKVFGLDISVIKAGVFTVSGVLGSAISIVPSGLGIREGVSAILSLIIGLNASAGFMTAALNRILSLFFLAPLSFFLGVKYGGPIKKYESYE